MPSRAFAASPLEVTAWALIIATLVVVLTATGVAIAAYFQTAPPPRVWAATAMAPRATAAQRDRAHQYGPVADAMARRLAASGAPGLASAAPRAQWPYPEGPVVDVTPQTPEEFRAALRSLLGPQEAAASVAAMSEPLRAVKLDYNGVRIVVEPPPPQGEAASEHLPPVRPEELAPKELAVLGALEALSGAVYYPKRTSRKTSTAVAASTRPPASYAVRMPMNCPQ